jgi:UDP-glucose 4-epimerase
MQSTGNRCCVIGGAGFIGSHVTRLLAASGREVVVFGRRKASEVVLPQNVSYVSGDYADRSQLKELLAEASEVVDLAYLTVPKTSFADPVYDILANLPASVGLLLEAAACPKRKILLVSSGGTVYGVAARLPIAEDHPTRPVSPYGITKLALENYAWMFHHVSNLPVCVARPANAYGEEQRTLSGQGFIAAAMHCITTGREIDIYGPEGTVRDYVYVSDIATGIVATLEHGAPGQAYNIGTGAGHSNLDVLRLLEPLASRAGLKVQARFLPPRHFDVPANVLDSSKLTAAAGWRPATALREGIEQTWDAVLARVRNQALAGTPPAASPSTAT